MVSELVDITFNRSLLTNNIDVNTSSRGGVVPICEVEGVIVCARKSRCLTDTVKAPRSVGPTKESARTNSIELQRN